MRYDEYLLVLSVKCIQKCFCIYNAMIWLLCQFKFDSFGWMRARGVSNQKSRIKTRYSDCVVLFFLSFLNFPFWRRIRRKINHLEQKQNLSAFDWTTVRCEQLWMEQVAKTYSINENPNYKLYDYSFSLISKSPIWIELWQKKTHHRFLRRFFSLLLHSFSDTPIIIRFLSVTLLIYWVKFFFSYKIHHFFSVFCSY